MPQPPLSDGRAEPSAFALPESPETPSRPLIPERENEGGLANMRGSAGIAHAFLKGSPDKTPRPGVSKENLEFRRLHEQEVEALRAATGP